MYPYVNTQHCIFSSVLTTPPLRWNVVLDRHHLEIWLVERAFFIFPVKAVPRLRSISLCVLSKWQHKVKYMRLSRGKWIHEPLFTLSKEEFIPPPLLSASAFFSFSLFFCSIAVLSSLKVPWSCALLLSLLCARGACHCALHSYNYSALNSLWEPKLTGRLRLNLRPRGLLLHVGSKL